MKLLDIVQRDPVPKPWAEGEKIPWHDPEFSRRMLREHLSQEHDHASRRSATIDRQVQWINRTLLSGKAARILDLGCGPGLYTSRLARLGHECVGIDFSPASVAYAREQAERERLTCTYRLEDIRSAEYDRGYGLVMLIYGEPNVFRPEDVRLILAKSHRALAAGGILLLEAHTEAAVREIGQSPRAWYSSASGLFSDGPHLMLHESFWDGGTGTATERYFVIDALSGAVTRHASTTQAYTDRQYEDLITESGFGNIEFHESLTGEPSGPQRGFQVIVARKKSSRGKTVKPVSNDSSYRQEGLSGESDFST